MPAVTKVAVAELNLTLRASLSRPPSLREPLLRPLLSIASPGLCSQQVQLAATLAQKVSLYLQTPRHSLFHSRAPVGGVPLIRDIPLISDVNIRGDKTALIPTPLLEGLGLGHQLRLVSMAWQNPRLELKESLE